MAEDLYLVTERELQSATVNPAGELEFTRENGQKINAGKVRGDITPEAIAARDAAVAAKNDAVAAKNAAQAVGTTNDTIMTNVARDPASQFGAQLSATFAGRPTMPYGDMRSGQPAPPTVRAHNPALVSHATTNDWTWRPVDNVAPENVSVTFVVPSSGRVQINLSAGGQAFPPDSGLQWGVAVGGALVSKSQVTVIQPGPTGGQAHRRLSVSLFIDSDGAGAPLVPGKTYTAVWVHRDPHSGTAAETNLGGAYGPAVMEVIPVSDRLTEVAVTAQVAPSDYCIMWMSADRSTVFASNIADGVWGKLAWSVNDGDTWTTHPHPFGSIQGVRDLGDGEILVFTGDLGPGAANCAVWKSSGWSASRTAATFRRVHEALSEGQSWGPWAIDAHGPIVVAGEYGTKVSPANMARYAYMSEDYGNTWRVIFDLAPESDFSVDGAHLHGMIYDPWWDAIWLCNGDGVGNAETRVSFDRGRSWRNLNQSKQWTTMYAFPDCVLFVTDSGSPNGVYRVPRQHPSVIVWELAWKWDDVAAVTILGSQMFKAKFPGSPLVMAIMSGQNDVGRLWVTYDGETFKEVWNDAGQIATNHGLKHAVGPTASGKYLGWVQRNSNLKLMLKVQPKW